MAIYVEPVRPDFWQLAKKADGSYLDPLGPKDCMTHSAARAVMRHQEGHKPAVISGVWPPTGYEIRRHCIDPATHKPDISGGVRHSQVQAAVKSLYGVELVAYYGNSFDDLVDLIAETRGAMISLWYKRIRDNAARRGSFTFYQNHEIFANGVDRTRSVFTGVVDPLADGRQAGLYHGPGEYPFSLIKPAMGELNVSQDPNGYVPLGSGKGYFMVTKPTYADEARWWPSWMPAPPASATFSLTVRAGTKFNILDSSGRYLRQVTTTNGFTAYGNSRKRLASGAVIGNLITGPYRGYVNTAIGVVRNKPV